MHDPALLRSILVATALSSAPALASADVVRIPSAVDGVTLFPTGASVHRAGRVQVEPGDHEVVFGPLPPAITDDSIRVGGMGPGATILGVTVRTGRMLEVTGAGALEQLAGEVSASERDLARMTAEQADMTRRREIERTQEVTPGRMTALARQLIEIAARIAELTQRHAERMARLARARAEGDRPVKWAMVDVTTASAGELQLNIAYQIPGNASWAPSYAAHLDEAGARVALDVYAAVQQSTGEDWNGVRLAITTVAPTQGLALPQLEEQDIELEPLAEIASVEETTSFELHMRGRGRGMPSAMGVASAAGASAMDSIASSPIAPPPRPRPVEVATGHATANLLSARIDVPGTVTLRSGANPRRVLAAHHDYDVHLEHHTVPRASSVVYMTTRFANDAPFPLLAGNVALFLGSEYVGSARMNATNAGDDVSLPFGVDAAVSIERSLADRHVAQRAARDETSLRYDYRVTNHRERAVSVTVLDQIPVSRSVGLQVQTLPSTRPTTARRDNAVPGSIAWHVQALPGTTHRWSLGYVVSAPHRRVITGSIE